MIINKFNLNKVLLLNMFYIVHNILYIYVYFKQRLIIYGVYLKFYYRLGFVFNHVKSLQKKNEHFGTMLDKWIYIA